MKKLNFLDRLFPPKYNFHQYLSEQAALTARGVQALSAWLTDCYQVPDDQWNITGESVPSPENHRLVIFYADKADEIRLKMEADLIEAFSTPFQRQDIYFLSVQMDKIIEAARTALRVVESIAVKPDQVIDDMAQELAQGTMKFAEAVDRLESNPIAARNFIAEMRRSQAAVESRFLQGLADLYQSADPIPAMRYREVYVQLRNGSRAMESTVDILHRVVVRLV